MAVDYAAIEEFLQVREGFAPGILRVLLTAFSPRHCPFSVTCSWCSRRRTQKGSRSQVCEADSLSFCKCLKWRAICRSNLPVALCTACLHHYDHRRLWKEAAKAGVLSPSQLPARGLFDFFLFCSCLCDLHSGDTLTHTDRSKKVTCYYHGQAFQCLLAQASSPILSHWKSLTLVDTVFESAETLASSCRRFHAILVHTFPLSPQPCQIEGESSAAHSCQAKPIESNRSHTDTTLYDDLISTDNSSVSFYSFSALQSAVSACPASWVIREKKHSTIYNTHIESRFPE